MFIANAVEHEWMRSRKMGKGPMIVTVERDGQTFYLNLTRTRKLRGVDSALLFRLEDGKYVFDHYERVDRLRKEGYR